MRLQWSIARGKKNKREGEKRASSCVSNVGRYCMCCIRIVCKMAKSVSHRPATKLNCSFSKQMQKATYRERKTWTKDVISTFICLLWLMSTAVHSAQHTWGWYFMHLACLRVRVGASIIDFRRVSRGTSRWTVHLGTYELLLVHGLPTVVASRREILWSTTTPFCCRRTSCVIAPLHSIYCTMYSKKHPAHEGGMKSVKTSIFKLVVT